MHISQFRSHTVMYWIVCIAQNDHKCVFLSDRNYDEGEFDSVLDKAKQFDKPEDAEIAKRGFLDQHKNNTLINSAEVFRVTMTAKKHQETNL